MIKPKLFMCIAIALLAAGAVTMATLFIGYYLDLSTLPVPADAYIAAIREGQLSMSKITSALTVSVLGLTAVAVLLFSAARFISDNFATMGILKALGYTESEIALRFAVYGIPVAIGCAVGWGLGSAISPFMYDSMTEFEEILPTLSFHVSFPLLFVLMPAAVTSILTVVFARFKLLKEPLDMIKNNTSVKTKKRVKPARNKPHKKYRTFMRELKSSMRRNHTVLYVFVGISVWAFSTCIQMAFTMTDIGMQWSASAISAVIGVIMGFVTLTVAAEYVVSVNKPYISVMKAHGYTDRECGRTLLDDYRPMGLIGFALGSVYQYFLMKLMVSLFAGAYDVTVEFSVVGFFVTLAAYIIYYEGLMLFYKRKISDIPLKQAVSE